MLLVPSHLGLVHVLRHPVLRTPIRHVPHTHPGMIFQHCDGASFHCITGEM